MNILGQYFCCMNENSSVQKINKGLSFIYIYTHTLKIMKIGMKNEVEIYSSDVNKMELSLGENIT